MQSQSCSPAKLNSNSIQFKVNFPPKKKTSAANHWELLTRQPQPKLKTYEKANLIFNNKQSKNKKKKKKKIPPLIRGINKMQFQPFEHKQWASSRGDSAHLVAHERAHRQRKWCCYSRIANDSKHLVNHYYYHNNVFILTAEAETIHLPSWP